jgi:glycosyltransferase involved in cell wall biosynthesis
MVDPVVSVLTPVYNGEQYLEECIQSVLRQTYHDWDYIIFDNSSTDGTAAIAEHYAAKDTRIRVVRATEHLDVHGSHNRAVRAAHPRSRYLKIVHADDWIYPECLERMVAVAEGNPSAALVSAYRLEGKEVKHDDLFPYSQDVMSGREVMRQALLDIAWVTGSPTSLLLRSDLVRKPGDFYDSSVWHSDTDAAYRVMMDCDVGFVHQVLTFTRIHPDALTSSFSRRVNSYLSHRGRMLIRYGPKVLTPREYRVKMRKWLARYISYLARQRSNPSGRKRRDFDEFHRKEIRYMIDEGVQDRETRVVLSLCATILLNPRQGGGTRVGTPGC